MKAVETTTHLALDAYTLVEHPVPTPADDELLVCVEACGLGYVDALIATGGYQVTPPLPYRPGQEIAGTVEAAGAAVSGFARGDRVMATSAGGGLAEFVCVKAHAATPLPAELTPAQAAGFRVNYLTAMHALIDRGALSRDERLLVLGAAGGTGSAALQVAHCLGAEVIACASTQTKRSFAENLGAKHVLDTNPDGWRQRLKATGPAPGLVFDPICGPLFELAFRSLGWRGRHLVIGFLGDGIPRLPANLPLMKGAALVGVDLRQFLGFEPDQAARHLSQLLQWVQAGELSPPIGRAFPLQDFQAAMTFALSGQGIGKTVIEIT